MMTPASTPKTRVPTMAATAIQKSNLFTRASRRISGTFIMPMTTASVIRAASTGLGRFEKRGARNSSVSRTVTPDVSEARPVLAPEWSFSELADRLVETGMPWNSPRAHVCDRLGYGLLVDVDLVGVLGRERPRITRGLGEADQEQGHRRECNGAHVVPHQLTVRELRRRQPPRHVAHQRHPLAPRSNKPGGQQPADDQDQGTGDPGRDHPQPEDDDQRDDAHDHGCRVCLAQAAQPRPQLLDGVGAGDVCPGQFRELADDHVDRRPEEEAGDHCPGEELRNPAHLEDGEEAGTGGRTRA